MWKTLKIRILTEVLSSSWETNELKKKCKKFDFRLKNIKNIESSKFTSKALDELSLRVMSERLFFTKVTIYNNLSESKKN